MGNSQKRLGQFFTPPGVARTLVRWVANDPRKRLLDPACGVHRLSEVGHAGIGYVTGANNFFHLRPTEAQFYGLPSEVLRVSVRKAEQLPDRCVDRETVRSWLANDEPVLLLSLRGVDPLPKAVREYLSSDAGQAAQETYKCRNRHPWYVVPDVKTPDAFLSYMSGRSPSLVANRAGCACTSSVHAVQLSAGYAIEPVQRAWETPLCQLSCEIEGHPLGGGMLKLEPGEAAQVSLPLNGKTINSEQSAVLAGALAEARRWRHYD